MDAYFQVFANGLTLGALYACIAVGFSLVWGVLNAINMLHGSLIILGGYAMFAASVAFFWLIAFAGIEGIDAIWKWLAS